MGILELLQTYPPLFIAVCLILGLMVGSFLNVVIHRLPKMLETEWRVQCAELAQQSNTEHPHDALPAPAYNLIIPHSACPHCNHAITALENIPVISYLVLRGKCSSCGAAISPRYPLIETISGLLCALAAWHFGYGMMATGAIILLWALLALTAIDLDTMLLPDDITLPLLWIGLLFNLFGVFTDLHSAVLGAMAGYPCYGACTGCSS
jgi:leader peptidase (prepilin peptidase)/N-methyltransferase